ncbi:alpha/beta hydrolase [Skermania piniformis]|uniref:Esterase family protein n=1 Tax=Skermania pinensis TaxID=39122 RepID=A0ABX8S9E2_9ACTN|nr:alpha/beta hydrolase family protein [Skermania piniformis]QXQ14096.1 esterase family protein [Skermania piniformis]
MIRGRRWARRSAASVALVGVLGGWFAAPAPAAPASARIDHREQLTPDWQRVFVDSPSMGRVELQVLSPAGRAGPRPTLYLLDGRSANAEGSYWTARADVVRFFADQDVNVVLPVGGPGSYYTDWQRPDPRLGVYRWETLLTEELPALIDAEFGGNGVAAVAGVSMGGQGALMLAARHPGRYVAAAGYSGCYRTGDDLGQAQARLVVGSVGGDPNNMFGPPGDPDWAAHDVVAHAEGLRGTTIYLSAGSGLPGPHERLDNPELATAVAFGGPIEAAVAACTRDLATRLAELDIPATVAFRPAGTHSWPYWSAELRASWPILAGALGIDRPVSAVGPR